MRLCVLLRGKVNLRQLRTYRYYPDTAPVPGTSKYLKIVAFSNFYRYPDSTVCTSGHASGGVPEANPVPRGTLKLKYM